MNEMLSRRLSMLTIVLVSVGALLLARVGSFQFQLDTAAYLQNYASTTYRQPREQVPDRGRIFDRNGELLAGNEMYYRVGVSPALVSDKRTVAHQLAPLLTIPEETLFNYLQGEEKYIPLTENPVSTELAQQVAKLDYPGVVLDPVPRRIYPQGALAGPVIGFLGGNGKGYVGVEGYHDTELAGQTRFSDESPIPFDVNPNNRPPPGDDIYLTLDRSMQYLAETELQQALEKYKSDGGSIIVMDPRNGEILAMASYPGFDPNQYSKAQADAMKNPAISDLYEPGSVFKLVSMSSALDSGKVSRLWTYNDTRILSIGGRSIMNWDHAGHGSTSFDTVLIKSYNVGTSNAAITMGQTVFYDYLAKRWGVNARTGIDMEGEATGILRQPGDTYWDESTLATNSFGQGLQVTPLQMLCYVNAIANDGQMMQPHIMLKRVHGETVFPSHTYTVRTPIKPDTAHQIRDIMVQVVRIGEGQKAAVPGYAIAGKTGTAQYVNPQLQDYDPYNHETTFVGFFPADEPRVSVLIRISHVPLYASESAAPVFSDFVQRLVVMMNIPTDKQRAQLQAQGGNTSQILGTR